MSDYNFPLGDEVDKVYIVVSTDKPVTVVFEGDASIVHRGNGVYTIYKKRKS